MLESKVKLLLLRGIENVSYTGANVLIAVAEKLERVETWAKQQYNRRTKAPSVMQYANRLIEYADHPVLLVLFSQYMSLIDSGIDPESAFELVTRAQ